MASTPDRTATVDDDIFAGSTYRRFERRAEVPMLALSVVFVVALIIDEVIDGGGGRGVDVALITIWVLFAVEVGVLFVLAPSKRTMFREHWLDVVIVGAPFLRPLRIARLARLVRAGGLAGRALRAVNRVTSSRGVQAYAVVAAIVMTGCGLLVWLFDRNDPERLVESPADGLWWAIVTVTTVGYGDVYPTTTASRAISIVLMLVGIGLVGVITANIAALMVSDEQEDELDSIRVQLDRIETTLQLLLAEGPDGRTGDPGAAGSD